MTDEQAVDDAAGDGGDDRPEAAEIRARVVEQIAGAHVGAAVVVTCPRADNEVDELNASTALFLCDEDMSLTEVIAGTNVVEDGLAELADDADVPSVVGSSDEPEEIATMPAPEGLVEALVGDTPPQDDGDDTDTEASDQRGFE
jgi:hypothetical protein